MKSIPGPAQIAISVVREENSYTRVVRPGGNPQALKLIDMVFKAKDAPWRGIGIIPYSGLAIKKQYDDHNAQKLFELEEETDYTMPEGCRCGEILRAQIYPWECPLFNTSCKPDSPVGPCMVSREGGCYIAAKYGREYKYVSETFHKFERSYIARFKEKYASALSETPCVIHLGNFTTNPMYGNKGRRSYEELDHMLRNKWKDGKWWFTYQYYKWIMKIKIWGAIKKNEKFEISRKG